MDANIFWRSYTILELGQFQSIRDIPVLEGKFRT